MNNMLKSTLLSLLLAVTSGLANAEQMKTFGSWEVHYIALNTTELKPSIAQAYGIQRSKYNGFVNISVLDTNSSHKPAQTAVLTGFARDLMGRRQPLEFKEIKEGSAIYYIAEFDFQNEEVLKFEVTIANGAQQSILRFENKFYAD